MIFVLYFPLFLAVPGILHFLLASGCSCEFFPPLIAFYRDILVALLSISFSHSFLYDMWLVALHSIVLVDPAGFLWIVVLFLSHRCVCDFYGLLYSFYLVIPSYCFCFRSFLVFFCVSFPFQSCFLFPPFILRIINQIHIHVIHRFVGTSLPFLIWDSL